MAVSVGSLLVTVQVVCSSAITLGPGALAKMHAFVSRSACIDDLPGLDLLCMTAFWRKCAFQARTSRVEFCFCCPEHEPKKNSHGSRPSLRIDRRQHLVGDDKKLLPQILDKTEDEEKGQARHFAGHTQMIEVTRDSCPTMRGVSRPVRIDLTAWRRLLRSGGYSFQSSSL